MIGLRYTCFQLHNTCIVVILRQTPTQEFRRWATSMKRESRALQDIGPRNQPASRHVLISAALRHDGFLAGSRYQRCQIVSSLRLRVSRLGCETVDWTLKAK